MKIKYSYIEDKDKGPVPIPERQLNGGLYTGERFAPDAGWANVPLVPQAEKLPIDKWAVPGYMRPGNNYQENMVGSCYL